MKLATLKVCIVPSAKLRDYLLNIAHADGSPKARFFIERGYSHANMDEMAEALQEHARDNHVVKQVNSEHGVKYVVICNFRTPDGRNPCIRSIWIDHSDDAARLVSAYPIDQPT